MPFFSLVDQLLHKRAADALDGGKAEADVTVRDRKAVIRQVHIGRLHRDAHLARGLDVLRNLLGNIEHARK